MIWNLVMSIVREIAVLPIGKVYAFARTVVIGLSFTLCSLPSQAETWVWKGDTKVSSVFPHESSFAFFVDDVNGTPVNPNGQCANRLNIVPSNPNYDAFVSAVMTALATQAVIHVEIDNDATACYTPVRRIRVFRVE